MSKTDRIVLAVVATLLLASVVIGTCGCGDDHGTDPKAPRRGGTTASR
jgi:hypothetical protein